MAEKVECLLCDEAGHYRTNFPYALCDECYENADLADEVKAIYKELGIELKSQRRMVHGEWQVDPSRMEGK